MTPRSQRSETTDLGRLKPVVELESTTAPAAQRKSVSDLTAVIQLSDLLAPYRKSKTAVQVSAYWRPLQVPRNPNPLLCWRSGEKD